MTKLLPNLSLALRAISMPVNEPPKNISKNSKSKISLLDKKLLAVLNTFKEYSIEFLLK